MSNTRHITPIDLGDELKQDVQSVSEKLKVSVSEVFRYSLRKALPSLKRCKNADRVRKGGVK